ncbi:hypothetical protein AK830_g9140 [Neonectria ditissima]|uniref:D-arabinitol 2-dehydrogenase [ribulose-forming] n=1 Tax=Neonectria ditissima TaxID=78410 RepID=A0A0P7BA41_9HYPO|nr:hypothetical protein AK830_g9140 [Neonectria ditissima]
MSKIAPILKSLSRQAPTKVTAQHTTAAALRALHTTSPARNAAVGQRHLLPEFSMKDKVVVVSGGARGLGLVQIEALLEAGAKGGDSKPARYQFFKALTNPKKIVHAIDRLPSPETDPASSFSHVAKRAREELGASLTYHQVDVRDVPQLNKVFEGIADETGRLDGLIAAAGINQETPALEYTAEDADRMMSINFTGCFMTAQAAARQMIRLKQPGSICLIASMSATIANKGMIAPVYNPSKAAVAQLGRNLASEWGQYGIRVNTLSPGYILTQMLRNLFNDYPERETKWPQENMLNRISNPEEYRGAAIFLLSDASSFMTGSDLRIDGGHASW